MIDNKRTILHVDLDAFYASVESACNPTLKGKPIAVIGDPELRHGIVLAKSYEAKKYGIKTGDAMWQATKKCNDIIFVPANYELYMKYSEIAKQIFSDYSDRCESFGLDESWIDLTGCTHLFGDGQTVANTIRERVKQEMDMTASVGVSFNKVFAKLGSDMNKPDGVTNIPFENFREIVWNLPVEDLLNVGKATKEILNSYAIKTIGRLAMTDVSFLKSRLGKNGEMLWNFANGLDVSPVTKVEHKRVIRSVGNSTTPPKDLVSDEEIRITLYTLCESISERMRKMKLKCRCIQISIKDTDFYTIDRQITLPKATCITKDILEAAFSLYKRHHTSEKPVRSLGVRALSLDQSSSIQLSLMPEDIKSQSLEILEEVIDDIRNRYGHFAIQRAVMLIDIDLSKLNPIDEHVIHPVSFLGS